MESKAQLKALKARMGNDWRWRSVASELCLHRDKHMVLAITVYLVILVGQVDDHGIVFVM